VDSEPGRGTTFRIYFPAAREPARPASGPIERVVATSGSERVLLVEDETGVRGLAATVLRRSGHTVVEAATPADALALPADELRQIDLLVTDVIMPGMSGRTLADTLRRDHPRLRTLYMSGYTGTSLVTTDQLTPREAFLDKPFTPDGLISAVRELIERAVA
jgi:CheY-like chemotaxis protein